MQLNERSCPPVIDFPQTLTLLDLPGEIRNKIWSHTFDYYDYVNCGKRIDITCFRPFPKIPVAATVCRQMMAEVLGVFLNDVDFVIWIGLCEGERDVRANTAYMRLCKLQREIGKVESAPTRLSEAPNAPRRIMSGRPWFDNIVKWAKTVHVSDLDLNYEPSKRKGWVRIVFEMLDTTVKLRSVPWKDVKQVLCSMQRIAAVNDFDWFTGGDGDCSSEYTVWSHSEFEDSEDEEAFEGEGSEGFESDSSDL